MSAPSRPLAVGAAVATMPASTLTPERMLAELRHFIPAMQRHVLRTNLQGEEAAFFRQKITEFYARIKDMPTTGQTDGQGMDAVAHLHYFWAGLDWFITKKDVGDPDDEEPGAQRRAFGWADLGHGGELGYIGIAELPRFVELDLHFTPTPLKLIPKVKRIG